MIEAEKLLLRLGIHSGQFYERRLTVMRNAYWYDQNALGIGVGDLTFDQPERIAENLENGELFAAVPSYFVESSLQPNMINSLLDRDDENPGMRFVARNFALLIVPRCIYVPGHDGGHVYHQEFGDRPTLSPRGARKIMQSVQELAG